MKLHLLLPAACLLSITSVHAGLGDAPDRIDAAYGAAVDTRKDEASGVVTKYYLHAGFGISVRFLNGKSQCETYLKADKSAMSAEEIAALLKANAFGSDWLTVYKNADIERWELKSRAATAVHSLGRNTMMVETKDFIRSGIKVRVVDPAAD